MSQQRTARRQPSLLVDPAQETVRRRCRDPINVENLLPWWVPLSPSPSFSDTWVSSRILYSLFM
uniref:E2F transcription factor 6 n=1 Tax=Mus musculus TaxID=10090 RepID=A0A1Y7VP85_MOUSE